MPSTAIQVPLTAPASSVRSFAQESGRQSFQYFATAILSQALPQSVFLAFEEELGRPVTVRVAKHELRRVVHAILLWASIQEGSKRLRIAVQGMEVEPPIPSEAVRWLYGSIRIVRPVIWAPEIIITCVPPSGADA